MSIPPKPAGHGASGERVPCALLVVGLRRLHGLALRLVGRIVTCGHEPTPSARSAARDASRFASRSTSSSGSGGFHSA
jgi:hypothetical protein